MIGLLLGGSATKAARPLDSWVVSVTRNGVVLASNAA